MCGFVGIIDNAKNHDYSSQIKNMLRIISHRGPDEKNLCIMQDIGVYLGFARLSMVDIEKSSQPHVSLSKQIIIMFNGEIYNYKELRSELEQSGIYFNTMGEVEVLYQLYLMHGEDFLSKLDGMFAICVIDIKANKCMFARDQFGIKPLYYYKNNDVLVFSSELTPIYSVYKTKIDRMSMELFFSCRFIPAPYTIYEKVYKVRAGEFIVVQEKEEKHTFYFRYNKQYDEKKLEYEKICYLLDKSIIECYDSSDVSMGLFLSGGLDSGIIATVLKKYRRNIGKNYTVDYLSNPNVEAKNVKDLAVNLKIPYNKIYMSENIKEMLCSVLLSLDEPIYSTVALSTYCLSKEAVKGVKGVLTGDGSDELVWGYEYLRNSLKKEDSIASYLDGIGWLKFMPIESLIESTIFSKADIWDILSDGCVIDGNMSETFRRIELFKRLPDYHLMRVDRMSMAVGIEARVPFLRKDYVEYMLGLSSDILICDSDPKRILKDAYKDILPDSLLSIRKIPFLSPVKFWIENIFMEDIIRIFNDNNLIESLGINAQMVKKIIDNYRGKYEDISNVWGMYVFFKWFEIHSTISNYEEYIDEYIL